MMVKKGRNSFTGKRIFLLVVLIFIIFINIYWVFFVPMPSPTGADISSVGLISFAVEAEPVINITNPLNITYNFSFGDPYILNLSVISNGGIQDWYYSLHDVRHNFWSSDIAFDPVAEPNYSFNAFRWENELFVTAYTPSGKVARANVSFFVFVNNTCPIIYNVNSSIYVCENQSLNYPFYGVDNDEELLDGIISPDYGSFMAYPLGKSSLIVSNFSLISPLILKNSSRLNLNDGFRSYTSNVSVKDKVCADTARTNITIIEINNPPVIEDVGVKTVWTKGDDSILYEEVDVNDVEYSLGYGSLTFNLTIWNSNGTIVNLFNITRNGSRGIINFTANNQTPLGVYNVSVCVTDYGIRNPYLDIAKYCGQDGKNITSCDNFSVTVTDRNRRPTITSHYPLNTSFNASGTSNLYFNVTKYDPDGTIPDSYWYADGILVEHDFGNSTDDLVYDFGCGVYGNHVVAVNVSDGLLWDYLNWSINLENDICFSGSTGGGGGGGGGPSCFPQWGCNPWSVCQNAEASLEQGVISGIDYRAIEANCSFDKIDKSGCGFQTRFCSDFKGCNVSIGKPGLLSYCLYTVNPNCFDKMKNCHDGDCELLVDCGGPCAPCPSCSDKKQNQGEEGVDCGGPCPWKCKPIVPLFKRKEIIYGFLILLLLLIVFIIVKLIRVLGYNKAIRTQRQRNQNL